MKLNLSPAAVNAVSTFQSNREMSSMLTDAEDFLIEHCYDDSLLRETFAILKGVRMIRRLLEDIEREATD